MNATRDYQRFASSIAMNASTPPNTRVSDDGMHITYGDKTLDIAKWRNGLRRLADEVTKELDDLCLHKLFGLSIPDNIFDDWGNKDRGYSWTKNGQFITDKRSLLAAMLKDPALRLAKVDEAGNFQFNIAEVWDSLRKCDSVNEKLALLSFFTAGQTPHVSEFVQHKFANSTRPRTVFRDYQSIWLATRRVKSENIMEKETFIPMKCHPELTKLLERYLLIVRPVEAELVKVVRDVKEYHTFTEFMWTKDCKPISPEAMRKAILEVFLGSEFEIREEDMDALASQAGHSIDMTRLRYAPEVGKIPSMSSDLLGRFARVSEAWWQVAGFRPGHPPMLPLRACQDLRAAAPIAPLQPQQPLAQAPAFDTQDMVLRLTSAFTAEIQKIEQNLEAMVRKAVAEAMIQSQYPHIGQPKPASLPIHTAPQSLRSVEEHPIEEVRLLSPSPVTEDPPMEEVRSSPPIAFNPAPLLTGDEERTDMYGLTQSHPDVDLDTLSEAVPSEMLDALLHLHFPIEPSPAFKSPKQAQAV